MRAILYLLIALLVAAPLSAAAPAPVRAEIDALLTALQASGCEFNRNGNWYSAAEAETHLRRKLDYLERKDKVRSSEQFIERAASASSMTGQRYWVRCEGSAPVESSVWLNTRLMEVRASTQITAPDIK